jgi:hypothetical protein
MKKYVASLFFIYLSAITAINAQTESEYGTLYRFSLKTALFPHPKRANGHTYQNQKFPAASAKFGFLMVCMVN